MPRRPKPAKLPECRPGKHWLRGDRVRERRLALGMTGQDLAIKAGMRSPSAVSETELERNDVTGDTLARLAVALNCSMDWLCGLSDVAERR